MERGEMTEAELRAMFAMACAIAALREFARPFAGDPDQPAHLEVIVEGAIEEAIAIAQATGWTGGERDAARLTQAIAFARRAFAAEWKKLDIEMP